MKNQKTFLTRSLIAFLFLGTPVYLNGASVSGLVSDDRNGTYVESAIVTVVETGATTQTERGGRYRIRDLAPGKYTLKVQAIGYPDETQVIQINDDFEQISANLFFYPEGDGETIVLEAFQVEGQAIGQAKSLNIRRSSDQMREVVSSDAMGQFVDRNPAEALTRVAGITVEDDQGEGSFLLIRGTSADMSNIQIDGVGLASPQEDGRRVNLNIITVDQLERIEVSKTWLPFQRGNVIGGTVDMKTRSALDRGEMFASVEVAGTYRDIRPDELSYRGAVTFGGVVDKEKFAKLGDMVVGFQFSVNNSQDYSGSDTVSWGYDPQVTFPHSAGPGEDILTGFVMNSMYLRDFNITRDRLGLSSRLEFKLNENHEFYLSYSDNTFDDLEVENIFRMRAYTNDALDWGGTSKLSRDLAMELGLDLNDPYIIGRLNPPDNLTFNEAIALGELSHDPENHLFTNSTWRVSGWRGLSHTVREDTITTIQAGGIHQIFDSLELDWKIYESEATRNSEEWELRFTTSTVAKQGQTLAGAGLDIPILNPIEPDINDDGILDRLDARIFNITEGSGAGRINKLFDSRDTRPGYQMNIKFEKQVGEMKLTTRGGFAVDTRDKSYNVDNNTSRLDLHGLDDTKWDGISIRMSDELFDGGEVENFDDNFGPFFLFGPGFNVDETLKFAKDPSVYGVNYIQDANDLNNNFTNKVLINYDATEDINGFYLQQSVEWQKWTVIFGARYEETENTFTNLAIVTRPEDREMFEGAVLPEFLPPSSWRLLRARGFDAAFSETVVNKRSYDHWLPALHIRRAFGENFDLRFSVTKTIARPLFTDLIPREIIEIEKSAFIRELELPAFDLRPLESVNFDISMDYYFKPIGLFSLALFHKELDGPIYKETRTFVLDETTAPFDFKYDARARTLPWNLSQKRNSGEGRLSGVELTFDRTLNFVADWLDGFGFRSNISWFDSEATLTTVTREEEKVPLFGQPNMTANLSLYYNKHNVFARLSFNRRGEYLRSVGTERRLLDDIGSSALDTYVAPANRLDLTVRYNITNSFQVFLEATNLTNEPLVWYLNSELFPLKKQYTERVFTLGLKWTR